MPRAHRYFLPNHVWHITHRCHRKEFLLKFVKDRRCWRSWLYQAKKRYGLCVLNYILNITVDPQLFVLPAGDQQFMTKSLYGG